MESWRQARNGFSAKFQGIEAKQTNPKLSLPNRGVTPPV